MTSLPTVRRPAWTSDHAFTADLSSFERSSRDVSREETTIESEVDILDDMLNVDRPALSAPIVRSFFTDRAVQVFAN